MRKLLFIVFGVILSLIFSLGLFLYLFNGNASATESSWEVVKGENKITNFEIISWFGPNPYLYTVSDNKNEIIFAPYTQFYIEPWTPKGEKEGQYVWKLNPNTLSMQPILYSNFIASKPQFKGKSIKLFEILKQQINYNLAINMTYSDTVIETIAFNSINKRYEVRLSVSGFKRLQQQRFGIKYIEQKQSLLYSGILHFKVFDLSQPTQPIVHLKKQFNDWDYPLKSQGKKYTQRSILAPFCKLYFLPDSRPCLMLSSTAYQGRIYEHQSGVGDETFSLIIP
jgi:hypothetical protein